MFEASQENPLLAAAAMRSNLANQSTGLNITSQGKQESRNPFAKKVAGAGTIGSPSQSGIVFDSLKMNKPAATTNERSGFGQRKIVLNTQDKSKKNALAKPSINKEKENRSNNTEGLLKGFQLYFAENKNSYEDESSALMSWKSLDKSVKDSYQEPRIPNTGDNKRKREGSDGDSVDDGKKLKSGATTKQKLSGFAFN